MAKAKRPNLNRLVKKWQPRLRLQDWHIQIAYGKPEDFSEHNKGALGENLVSSLNKECTIHILDPKYIVDEGLPSTNNVELTVVHELVHCHIPTCKMTLPQMETAVEQIAKAFMEI